MYTRVARTRTFTAEYVRAYGRPAGERAGRLFVNKLRRRPPGAGWRRAGPESAAAARRHANRTSSGGGDSSRNADRRRRMRLGEIPL